ncbi:hypothetical protein FB451DRAFT_1467106 [Mycena latifolia]|nr:hypothetical protein FB451DRAFT_1467106 [Mycena latifolia]
MAFFPHGRLSILAEYSESTSAFLLVCKAWLRVATPLLYHTVVVRSKGHSVIPASHPISMVSLPYVHHPSVVMGNPPPTSLTQWQGPMNGETALVVVVILNQR